MMTLLLDSVKVGPDAQHGREQHAPLHVAAKAGKLNTLFAFQKPVIARAKNGTFVHFEWQMECYKDLLVAIT